MDRRDIFYEHYRVGWIDSENDTPTFHYDQQWLATKTAFPISLSMPLSENSYDSKILVPWLANLLPEEGTLVQAGQFLGVSTQDVLGLLDHMGRDIAGAVSIGYPRPRNAKAEYKEVATPEELERILNELPRRPFLVGDDSVSMSLAGAQAKLAVWKTTDRIAIPINGTPSTHILKPDHPNLWGSVQNEAFCLILARRVGLNAISGITTGTAGNRSYLLVPRYDRAFDKNQHLMRLHQEDFCQVLGRAPSQKYQRATMGGIHAREMFELTRRHLKPAEPIRLLSNFVFNLVACNTDAHAKNYSILLQGRAAYSLAPIYEMMCAAVWDRVTRNIAQSIAGKTRGDHIYRRHWARFAADCSLGPAQLIRHVKEIAVKAIEQLEGARQEVENLPTGPHPIIDQVRREIEGRANRMIKNLDDLGEDVEEETSTAGSPGI